MSTLSDRNGHSSRSGSKSPPSKLTKKRQASGDEPMDTSGGDAHRASVSFESLCGRFQLKDRGFNRQYYVYYSSRLTKTHEPLKRLAKNKWGPKVEFTELKELDDELGDKKICVIGTLFKRMKLQPSVLKEVSEDLNVVAQPVLDNNFTSDDDYLALQDFKEAVTLIGEIYAHEHVTGIPVALLGTQIDNGSKFQVEDVLYLGCKARSVPRPKMTSDQYVIIVSGLGFSRNLGKPEYAQLYQSLQLFRNFLTGKFTPSDAVRSAQVVRLIVAGNFLHPIVREEEKRLKADNKLHDAANMKKIKRPPALDAINHFDDYIASLAKFVEIDLIPGEIDPTTYLIPQQPIHPCILPKCSALSSVNCATNPYLAKIGGLTFLGSGGQTIDAIKRYTTLDEATKCMRRTLMWGHLAPSAPDNISSYPYPDADPFIIDELPDVYFTGNQAHFNQQQYIDERTNGDCLLVSLPQFCKEFLCASINLRTLKCDVLSFN